MAYKEGHDVGDVSMDDDFVDGLELALLGASAVHDATKQGRAGGESAPRIERHPSDFGRWRVMSEIQRFESQLRGHGVAGDLYARGG